MANKNEETKGSVLVFTLIILGIILTAALGVASVSVIERKSASTTGQSVTAFQVANYGAEQYLYCTKDLPGTTLISSIRTSPNCGSFTCTGGEITVSSGDNSYTVTFWQNGTSPIPLQCSNTIDSIDYIKSVGEYKGSNRAVEVSVLRANSNYEIGVFKNSGDPSGWILDYDGSGTETSQDSTPSFGRAGDIPVTGDWNGDGKTEIGTRGVRATLCPAGNCFYLDYDTSSGFGGWDGCSTDICTPGFGLAGDKAVSGDWNDDGITEIGIFRESTRTWALDSNTNSGFGTWDGCGTDRCIIVPGFGSSGDTPVTGDWDGNGTTKIGFFRDNGVDTTGDYNWFLDMNNDGIIDACVIDKCLQFGLDADTPVTGDWNGDGTTEIGVARKNTGNWDWYLDYDTSSRYGFWDLGTCSTTVDKCIIGFGLDTGDPVTGDWY